MKRLLFSCLLFLAIVCSTRAALTGRLYIYFPEADRICDVRVVSVEEDKITFSVVEVLRGNQVATLVLRDARIYDFEKDDEWMLLSCESWRKGNTGDFVGSFMKIPVGWICARVFREDGKAYVDCPLFDPEKKTPVFDKQFGNHDCITLDHFKQMMAGKPFISWYLGAGESTKGAADYCSDVVVATIAPADTWKPVDQEPDCRFVDMNVIDALKGKFSGKVSVIYQLRIDQTNPEPGNQYIAFLAGWSNGYRIVKLLPATKENVDAVKAVIAAK